MFLRFFFQLRAQGIKVSPTEWLSLMTALARGFERADLAVFYGLARGLIVKREGQYDAYDRAFAAAFEGVDQHIPITDELLAWLDEPIPMRELSEDERRQLQAMDLETLRQQLKVFAVSGQDAAHRLHRGARRREEDPRAPRVAG